MQETRSFATEFEIRAMPNGKAMVRGHGAVYSRLSSDLGGFVEMVDPGAFRKTLADNPDTRGLINHDPMHILGRTRSGTLRMYSDSIGLGYEIDMPDRGDAHDLMVSMERGDVTQSSFAFRIAKGGDEWMETEDGYPLRMLRALNLHNGDVSPVTYPAYEAADSGLCDRAYRSIADRTGLPFELVQRAATENNLADLLRNGAEAAPKPQEARQGETHRPAWLVKARLLYPGTARPASHP